MADADEIRIERDLIYMTVQGRDLLCDVYHPAAERQKHLAVLHVHGGGGNGGSKDRTRLSVQMAQRGYTSIAIQYRLAPDFLWPSQMLDIDAGLQWVLTQADSLQVDPERVVILGYSIGGQMALLVSATGQEVAACVALYPASSKNQGTRTLLGGGAEQTDVDRLDPARAFRPGFPPTILLHGGADTVVDVQTSFDYYKALVGVGVPTELHVVEGVDHGFDSYPEFAEPCADLIDLFIDRHVVSPRSYGRTTERAAR